MSEVAVLVTSHVRTDGPVVVLAGLHEDGGEVTFAVDHRYAGPILDALDQGEQPTAAVPAWAFL